MSASSGCGRRLGFALALAVSVPAAASGRDLWTSDDETSTLSLQGFYKSFPIFLLVPPDVVRASAALATLADEAQPLLPPALGATLSVAPPLPRQAALSSHILRVGGAFVLGNGVRATAAWQVTGTVGSAAFVAPRGATFAATSSPGPSTASSARRRLVDFAPLLAASDGFVLQHDLGELSLRAALGTGELVFGRQILSFGTGRFWNPTDLLSPFAPSDVDKEVRRGVDAVRFSWPLAATALVDVLWLPQKRGVDQGGLARVQGNAGGFDMSVSAAKYLADLVLGADAAGDVGPLGVHVEGAYTLGLTSLGTRAPPRVAEQFVRAVAGIDWKPTTDLMVVGEYYFNGFGAAAPAGYVATLQSVREQSGEIYGAGRHYLGLGVLWRASDLLSINTSVITNLCDPSAMILPTAEYWFEQSVIVRVGGLLPLGRRLDPSALERLSVADAIAPTPAFVAATRTLGVQSEYGMSSAGVFAEVGVYF